MLSREVDYHIVPKILHFQYILAEGVGFEPTRERKPPGGFQDRCLKPLGHPSISGISNS